MTPKEHQSDPKQSKSRSLKVSIPLLLAIALIGWFSGFAGYAFATVRCLGLPVTASRFAASYSYVLPGEPYYSISPFEEYYCTEADAISSGFHHNPLTEAQLRRMGE